MDLSHQGHHSLQGVALLRQVFDGVGAGQLSFIIGGGGEVQLLAVRLDLRDQLLRLRELVAFVRPRFDGRRARALVLREVPRRQVQPLAQRLDLLAQGIGDILAHQAGPKLVTLLHAVGESCRDLHTLCIH
jgi:hypothetical protein